MIIVLDKLEREINDGPFAKIPSKLQLILWKQVILMIENPYLINKVIISCFIK